MAVTLFVACPESWEGMSGSYLGKRIECLPTLFDIYQIEEEDRLEVFQYFKIIESEYSQYIEMKRKQQESISGKKKNNNN